MPRRPKPRRSTDRLASPAQMARLRAAIGMKLPNPIRFEAYRDMMRSHMNPDSNVETREAAWEHLERPDKETQAKLEAFSKALHEARLARDTPPRAGEM
jgi:hypothetical protein